MDIIYECANNFIKLENKKYHFVFVQNRKSHDIILDFYDIIKKCRQVGGYTVLRFHNHPNSDPKRYTTLLASEQDKISAKSCAEYVCKEGFNWYDFVCARGEFIQFYAQISDKFEIRGGSTSDIIDKIGICPEMDYEFQKQYKKVSGVGNILSKKPIKITILVVVVVFSTSLEKVLVTYLKIMRQRSIMLVKNSFTIHLKHI